ncbi:hypothetical protein [Kitasatospora sp. NPDC089509]|uniref:hypothetical protein n=1 Tax=Kitasatospora sp. NPDC089509 TaxID=3364079 RepID=UPI0038036E77
MTGLDPLPVNRPPADPTVRATPLCFSVQGWNNIPLNAGSRDTVELIVVNHGKEPVRCARIAVTVPIGEGQGDLCSSDKDLPDADKVVIPPGWTAATLSKPETYAFESSDDTTIAPYGTTTEADQVSFRFPDVKLNRTPGKADLRVTAWTAVGTQDEVEPHSSEVILTKLPHGFFFDYLAPADPSVALGQSTKLLWSAEGVQGYSLNSYDHDADNPGKDDRELSTGHLSGTTGYTLEAFAGGGLSHRHQAIVEVVAPTTPLTDVTVREALLLGAAYASALDQEYRANQQQGQPLDLAEPADGDRWAVLAITETDGLVPDLKPPVLDVVMTDIHGGAPVVGSLRLDGTDSPLGLKLPGGSPLRVQAQDGWKTWQGGTLNARLKVLISEPRILPISPVPPPQPSP